MDEYFYHYFKPVITIHIVTVFALMFTSSVKSCRAPKHELHIPVQFIMEEAPKVEAKQLVQKQIPPPRDTPISPPSKPAIATPSASASHLKPKKVLSAQPQSLPKNRATPTKRTSQPQRTKEPKPVSAQEIEKILRNTFATDTSKLILDDEARCLELIRKTLYDVWAQPSAEEARGFEAIIGLSFDSTGHITQWRFIKKSGNSIFDETVTKALNSVSMVKGLSALFTAVKREITISFRVEETE